MAGLRRVLLGLWLEIRVIPVLLWSFTAITLGTALAWHDGDGIAVGGYLAALLGLSYYVRRRIGAKLWRKAHRATVVVWLLGWLSQAASKADSLNQSRPV